MSVSSLSPQPCETQYSPSEKTCYLLESLPNVTFFLWENKATQWTNTTTSTLKYHFVPDSLDQYLMENNFIWDDQKELRYVEVFKDNYLFSEMRTAGCFRKDVYLLDKQLRRRLYKSSNIVLEGTNTIRRYNSEEETIAMLDESSKERSNYDGIEMEILVTRRVYSHKTNKMIKITYDECEFPDGDCFSVCTFAAQIPEEMEKEIIESIAKQQQQSNIIQHHSPTRSKIMEYLYRYHPKVYASLSACNKMIRQNESQFKSTFLGKLNFHPLSKISSFFNGEIKNVESYLKNLIDYEEYMKNSLMVMDSLYRICRHYLPATNKALQNNFVGPEMNQLEIANKIENSMKKKQNCLIFYQFHNNTKNSHFELFVSPPNICEIEKLFETEISASSVRVSSSIKLLEVAFGKICEPEMISRAEAEFRTYSLVCQQSISTLLSNHEQMPLNFIQYKDYSKKTRRITNSRLAKLTSKSFQAKPNWVPSINRELKDRLTSALKKSQISLFELVISYQNFFVRVHSSHHHILEIERTFSAEIEKGIIRVCV